MLSRSYSLTLSKQDTSSCKIHTQRRTPAPSVRFVKSSGKEKQLEFIQDQLTSDFRLYRGVRLAGVPALKEMTVNKLHLSLLTKCFYKA